MATVNCESCESLRQDAPDFVVNGLTDDICTSLSNDTGLNPTSGNDDCTDLNNVADCLVGNMATEVEAYNVCDWKEFMKNFIPNVWTTLKAMICAICGLWKNVHCLNQKMSLLTVVPQVSAFRGGGTAATAVAYTSLVEGQDVGTLTVYMDAEESATANASPNGVYGSTPADRDYIALLTWCADGEQLDNERTSLQVSVRNNEQTEAYAMERAQHYVIQGVGRHSCNQTAFCYLPKGGHLLVRTHCTWGAAGSEFRVHEFSMVLLPVINEDIVC